jgi:aryl-alcohol dehydrogenase-like predicted oxidoreductase
MEKRPFGKTGDQVTPLGFGGGPVGFLQIEQERVTRILNLLLDAGVNLIDTAARYPGSEVAIGNAVGHRRDQYLLVSKCGSKVEGVTGEPWSAELVTSTVERALRNLQTDHLDVMLLHSCDLNVLKKGEALGALVKARDAGKIRFAGCSADNETAAYAATLPDISVIETSVNIADQANIDLVLPLAQKNDIGVLAKRPVANAAWKEPSTQQGIYAGYAATYHDRLKKMGIHHADFGFTGPASQAWTELALRFTLSQPGVHCAIIGTTNPDHAQQNLAAAAKGPLPSEVVAKIRDAFRKADVGRNWSGQT